MNKQPIINVGILLAGRIDFVLDTSYYFGHNILNQGEYSIEIKKNKMLLQGNDIVVFTEDDICLTPVFRTNSFLVKNVAIGIDFHWEQKEEQRFSGSICFTVEESKIRLINNIHLEDYIKSVVSSEMSAKSSPELLKAHAIISRSWIFAQLEKKENAQVPESFSNSGTATESETMRWYDSESHSNFDVCADDHCQRYHGITKILSLGAVEAVDDTRGQVLVYDGKICDTRFSKCCGGITENFETNWETVKKPYLVAVYDDAPLASEPQIDLADNKNAETWIKSSPDTFCNTADLKILQQILPDFDQKTTDFFRWQVKYAQDELSSLLQKRSGIDFGQILRLEALERGHSGRISKLRIIGTKTTHIVGKELEIRKWLSESHLYSSAFAVEYFDVEEGIPQQFVIKGAGWGHGTGLCQIGAAVMGESGYTHQQILSHYYKGATISKYY